jgi:hypothetical protein
MHDLIDRHVLVDRHVLIGRYCDAVCSLMIKPVTKILMIFRGPISITTGGKTYTISKGIILPIICLQILRCPISTNIEPNPHWPIILRLIIHIGLRRPNNLLWLRDIINWLLYWLMNWLWYLSVKFYYWVWLVLLFTEDFGLLRVVHFSVCEMLGRRTLEFFLLGDEIADFAVVAVLSVGVGSWCQALAHL